MDWEAEDLFINVYNCPEKYGLSIVATLERDLAFEFDMLVVWCKDDTGELYYAQDSGCSCPAPFEDYRTVDSLIRLESMSELQQEVRDYPYADASAFLRSVAGAGLRNE